MATTSRYTEMPSLPTGLLENGMHPETKEIITKVKATRGKVLSVRLESARAAKNRMDALRRAKKSKRVLFRSAHRKGNVLYVQVR